jgi:hypothetical protein
MGKRRRRTVPQSSGGVPNGGRAALIPVDRERWLRMAAEWSELARQAEEKPVIVQYRAKTLAEIAKSYAVDIR